MYYVLKTTGCDEPWWMTAGFEASVEEYAVFSDFASAKAQYIDWFCEYEKIYEHNKTRNPYMAAFYNDGDWFYCEDCGDDLQTYHSVFILDAKDEEIDETKFGDKSQAVCVNCPVNRQ